MLELIARSSLKGLTLGVRDHAALLQQAGSACEEIFKAHNHSCHVCGTRVPDGLEIDHGSQHVLNAKPSDLKPICQFCHNLKHPLWAASRGRLVAIYAPDISQVDLHRLAWSMVLWREVHPEAFETVQADLLARASRLSELLDCESVEAMFEAALATVDTLGADRALKSLRKVDQVLRFIPSEVMLDIDQVGDTAIEQGSRLSTWTIGGYRKIARTVAQNMLTRIDPEAISIMESRQSEEEAEDD